MRYLKSILVALILSVGILAGIGLMLKPDYRVERVVQIRNKPDSIYPFLADLKKWKEWSVWNLKKDPTLQFRYSGPERGIGSRQQWKGEQSEEGAIEITGLNPSKMIRFNFRTEGEMLSTGTVLLESQGKDTKVRWIMEGSAGSNLPRRYYLLFMENLVGTDMEEGLQKLKKICESR